MAAYVILKSGLVLHFIGIALMVGFTFASLITQHQVWKFIPDGRNNAQVLINACSRFQFWQSLGGILIVIGGVMMMTIYKHAIMETIWFKVKMIVVAGIIVNFILLGKPAISKLILLLNNSEGQSDLSTGFPKLNSLKKRVLTFHSLQILFFLLIFILSAFRFN